MIIKLFKSAVRPIALAVSLLLPAVASAFTVDGVNYSINNADKETVSLVSWPGAKGDITIPKTVTHDGKSYTVTAISRVAFTKNSEITSVTAETIVEVGQSAFNECVNLKTAKVGNGLKIVNAYAFNKCYSLSVVNLPEGLQSIGKLAFQDCKSLYSDQTSTLIIPSTITSLGSEAFVNSGIYALKFGINNGKTQLQTISSGAFAGCANLVHVTFCNGIVEIGKSAFVGCQELGRASKNGVTTIEIPTTVTTIGEGAFFNCAKLSGLLFHEGLTTIGYNAFCGCVELPGVSFPASLSNLGPDAFSGCKALAKINFKEGLTEIGSGAFRGCSALTQVDYPSTLTIVHARGFQDCKNLILTTGAPGQKIDVSEDQVYENCHRLRKHIDRDANHATLSQVKKRNMSVAVNVADKVIIGKRCYSGCKSLEELPKNISSYGEGAFRECESLTMIPEAKDMSGIPADAFYRCYGLTEIVLPMNIRYIGKSAFNDCDGLSSVKILNPDCSIGAEAFRSCDKLTDIELPKHLRVIGDKAFHWSGLTHIEFPDSLREIGAEAFYINKLVGEIVIPDSVNTIGRRAFASGSGITAVTFGTPGLVKKALTTPMVIGDQVFASSRNIKTVTSYHINPPVLQYGSDLAKHHFESEVYEKAVLKVPEGTADAYREAVGWSMFRNIEEMPSASVAEIEAGRGIEVVVTPDGSIVVAGNVPVTVYSIDGRMVWQGSSERPVVGLPRGLYIVSVPGASRKVRI